MRRPYRARAWRVQTGLVRRFVLLAWASGLAALAACGGPSAAHTSTPAPTAASSASNPAGGHPTNWLQYHGNEARTGAVAGLPPAGSLALAWSRQLSGAVYGEPLVVGHTVVAATETDDVYGLSWRTGAVLWKTRVGTPVPIGDQPCGNINPLGITSTPVYDPATKLVYVVAQDGKDGHLLAGLTLAGKLKVREEVPSPDHEPFYDQQRGALALTDGHVYVVFGGHYGDCGPYLGSVEGMPATGHGPVYSYVVPTMKQGGIWGTGGPVIAPDGTIYVSAGNGAPNPLKFDGSDSVTALTPQLKRTGIFAPADWRMLSDDDLDLGSASPALLSDGQILQVGKSGTGYLLSARSLRGVGGQIAQGQVCAAFGGPAVVGKVAYIPCLTGLAAVDTAGNAVRVEWRGPPSAWGSPAIGGGAVWVASPYTGVLYELSPVTGKVRAQIKVAGELPHFVSPSLSGSLVFIGTMTGIVAVSGA